MIYKKSSNLKQIHKGILFLSSIAWVVCFSNNIQASNGVRVIGPDANITALGGAGVAMPMTPNAPFLNPAGVNDVVDQVELGFTVIFPKTRMGTSLAPAGNPEAVNVGASDDAALLPGGGIATNLFSPKLGFGVAFYSSGGIQVEYPVSRANPAITNNQYDRSALYANLKIIPTFSYQVLDNLTVGGGVDINYAFLKTDGAVPALGFAETAGGNRYDSALGIGGRLGLIYKPLKWLRVGGTYIFRSRFHKFDRYTDLIPTGLDLPQQVAFGLAFLPMEGMTILTDFRWIDWSSGFFGTSLLQGGLGWRDQYVGAFGFSYNFAPVFKVPLTFRMGYNYGRAPIPSSAVFANLFIPPVMEHNLTTGIGFELSRHIGMDLAYLREFTNTITDDGSINPAGAGAFYTSSSNTFAITIRGHWGRSAKARGGE